MSSLDPSLPEGTIVCLDCDYQLQGLTKHRCPECGRGFDPGKKESFYVVSYAWEPMLKGLLGILYGLLALTGLMAIMGNMFRIMVFSMLGGMCYIMWIPTFFMTMGMTLLYGIGSRQPRRMKLRRVCIMVILTLASIPVAFLLFMSIPQY